MRKMLILAATLAILTVPVAAAESEPSLGDRISDLWQTAQDKAPGVWDAAKDKGSELYHSAKEKVPEVIDKAKDGLHDAKDAFSNWNQGQQDEFWQRIEDMQSGGATSAPPSSTDASQSTVQTIDGPSTTDQPNQPVVTPPPSTPANEPADVPPVVTLPEDGQAPGNNSEDPALKSEYSDALENPTIYYFNPNPDATTGTTPDQSINGEIQSLEQGDGYVIVNGERYEKAEEGEPSESSPVLILLAGILAIAACLTLAGMMLRYWSNHKQWRN